MTQITIFGGSGFVGRHLVRRLAKTGATIRIPTRNPEKALLLRPMGDVGQVVPFPCSMRSDTSVANAIGSSETVINLVGILFEKGRSTFQSIHVEGAARVARLAKSQGAKNLVHLSTLGASTSSKSKYAQSKSAGEQAVQTFFPDATILRPSLLFGPEDNFFNKFSSLAGISPVLPLIGGGHTKFQPVYVGDVAEAILVSLSQPAAGGSIYELGGPAIYSLRTLLEMMLRQTGRKRYLLNLPFGYIKAKAFVLEMMPHPLLTRDQVEMLKTDNIIVDRGAKTFATLGIAPTALELILPTYLGVSDAALLRAFKA